MATLNQEIYEALTPKQRKSLKSSSGWEIVTTVDTTDAVLRPNQKVTLIGESEEFGGPFPTGVGIQLTNGVNSIGSLITGNRSDTIIGSANLTGIALGQGTSISTNGGNDTLNGTGGSTGYGIFLNGALIDTGSDTGPDNDTINGSGGEAGIAVLFGSRISTDSENGSGNDSITGISEGVPGGSGGIGIRLGGIGLGNDGFIDTGDGNDSVTGVGANTGIFLSSGSSLSTGEGDDTVNALNGGFGGGSGTINLGADDDTLIGGGFGSGILFDGGSGDGDKIVLGEGTYFYDGSDLYNGSNDSGDKMNIENFELISGVAGAVLSSDLSTLVDDPTLNPDAIYTVNNEGLLVI